MRFEAFLLEANMTYKEALTFFGVESGYTPTDIKNIYKKMSLKYHPDRGGSVEMMQKVNAANDILSTTASQKSTKIDWEEIDRRYRDLAKVIQTDIQKKFDPNVFIKFFNNISNKEFHFSIINTYPKANDRSPTSVGFDCQFFTLDKDTVFDLSISVYLPNVMKSTGLSGGGNDYSIMVIAYGFHNNRKQKLSQSDWKHTDTHRIFTDASIIFPTAKLNKIFNSTAKKTFKKSDMALFLKNKLNATETSKDTVSIPINAEYRIYMYRVVFLKVASWSFNGLYNNKRILSRVPMVTLPENEETALMLEKLIKGASNLTDDKKIMDYFNTEIKKIK